MCVYKDTLYKDNMAEIWPKPTLFYFGPTLYKDNLEKIIKRVHICIFSKKIITIKTIFEIKPFDYFSQIVFIEVRTKIKKRRFWPYFPQIVLIDAHHSRQIYGNIFDNTPVLRKTYCPYRGCPYRRKPQ